MFRWISIVSFLLPLLVGAGAAQEREGEPTVRAEPMAMSSMRDDALWSAISKHPGNKAIVGIKAPGTKRGFWKNKWLLSRTQFQAAIQVLGSERNVIAIEPMSLPLPVVTVTLRDIAALKSIRRLPFVDYVEPLYHDDFSLFDAGSGCTETTYTLPETTTFTPDDDVVPWTFADIRVPEAWQRGVRGAGITVAVLDTGVFYSQRQLRMPDFASGYSGNRTVEHLGTFDSPWDWCSHGTRMAGVIAAPWDGSSVVGVAYGSNLLSIRVHDDVVLFGPINEAAVAAAIVEAASRHVPIIAMAFGTPFTLRLLDDVIDMIYYTTNVLFVAAAGTTPIYGITGVGVVFPARKDNVIAVAGVKSTNEPSGWSLWGDEVDVGAVIEVEGVTEDSPALGRDSFHKDYPHAIRFGGSSNATALTAGVLALIWSEYPWMNRDQVRERLYSTSSGGIAGKTGAGRIDAYKAVGGFEGARIDGPPVVRPNQQYTLTALPWGEGPFLYRWNNGATTQSVVGTIGGYSTSQMWTVEVTDLRENKRVVAPKTVKTTDPPPLNEDEFCFDPVRKKVYPC